MHRLGYSWRIIACGLLAGIKSERGWDNLWSAIDGIVQSSPPTELLALCYAPTK